jgi:23S rRNA (cytosine1962-C5)-methyltransferase
MIDLVVRRAAVRAIERGHPWIYKDAVTKAPRAKRGEARLMSDDGTAIGVGIFDPESPLAVRVWATNPHAGVAKLLRERLARCLDDRARLFDEETTAYRIAHGEGDRMPGVVIDRYGDACVVRPDGAAASELVKENADAIVDLLRTRGIARIVLREREREACMLHGSEIDAPVLVKEHGVPFLVDVMHGQKTGAFLDQRENRRRVGEIVRGLRKPNAKVLNLFSYAGGFSVHAARAGAVTTSVDVAAPAHKTAMESFRAAGVDPKGGVFCAASCSSHVDQDAFAGTLDDHALGRGDLSVAEIFGPPADHPTLAAWPEGRYLKFFVLR